jgi:hypothetical protein
LIDQMDSQLTDWVKETLGQVEVSLDCPANAPAGKGVSLYLIELANAFPSEGPYSIPLKLELRYLVTAWAPEPEEAHRMLGALAFAAMGNSSFEVDLHPLPAEVWLAFPARPRPAFILRVPVTIERAEAEKIVTKPLVVEASPLTSLEGAVLGPEDIPVAFARVEIPFLDLATYTDTYGLFRFPAVPVDPPVKNLRIVLKGWTLETPIEQPSLAHEPLVIHFDPFSEKRE